MSDRGSLGVAQANAGEITVRITEGSHEAKTSDLARPPEWWSRTFLSGNQMSPSLSLFLNPHLWNMASSHLLNVPDTISSSTGATSSFNPNTQIEILVDPSCSLGHPWSNQPLLEVGRMKRIWKGNCRGLTYSRCLVHPYRRSPAPSPIVPPPYGALPKGQKASVVFGRIPFGR